MADQSKIIYSTDKEVALVVLIKEYDIKKIEELLGEQNTYKKICEQTLPPNRTNYLAY